MKERIARIIQYKKFTNAQFAHYIGVQPSSITHILSGRNKPSLDFLIKIIESFPEISLEWLVLGKGEMLKKTEDTMLSMPENKTEITARELDHPSTDEHFVASLFSSEQIQNKTEAHDIYSAVDENFDTDSEHNVKSETAVPYISHQSSEIHSELSEKEAKNMMQTTDEKNRTQPDFTNVNQQHSPGSPFQINGTPSRVLLIYDDNTFECLFLRKKS